MFDKEAIETLLQREAITAAATAINNAAETHHGAVALPQEYSLHDLERFQETRRRARGTMTTRLADHFASYTKEHGEAGACVFVDPDSMSATAVLNLGTPIEPGHADNRALLAPETTAAYKALRAILVGAHSQKAVAEFFEDWPEHLQFFHDTAEIKGPQAIAAIRRITIENVRKSESVEQQLSASRSAFESVAATSADPLPTHVYFTCIPYADFESRTFVMRLGIQTGGNAPALTLRVQRMEKHTEEMAEELANNITAEFSDTDAVKVVIGTYKRAD